MIKAIIGANYGDEGKGLAVNHFTKEGRCLVVRHNGGAQSGHTVEIMPKLYRNGMEADKRFVFHELSSGSFNGADTYWADTYHPDLYTLEKEYHSFTVNSGGLTPKIFCSKDTKITLIDDVLLNCFKEKHDRAGSCGMGIWECVCRNNAGFSVTVEQVKNLPISALYNLLREIRDKYSIPKMLKYAQKYKNCDEEFKEMILNDTTLFNYVVEIKNNVERVDIIDLGELFDKYDDVIFENGQGLLIDGDLDMTHGTPSKTGLHNINSCLKKYGKTLDEAIYVTRTYLTRHGEGAFKEDNFTRILVGEDKTNSYNRWQGAMRIGRFDTIDGLVSRIKKDCPTIEPHILVTHANVTTGKMLTNQDDIDIEQLPFEKIYISDNRFTVKE